MYKINEIEKEGLNYIELTSSNDKTKVEICLNQGGRLSGFVFEGIQVLANYDTNTYKDNYASSILFPFANRIKDGEYRFNDKLYKLHCNETNKHNALHGTVYNKNFKVINSSASKDRASVTLQYVDDGNNEGFPFKFKINITYSFFKAGISISTQITNLDDSSFPFTLGWHPYFKSKNLNDSYINFISNSEYAVDEQQITVGTVAFNAKMPLQLKDAKLDYGYKLKHNCIEFITPEYNIEITSTSKHNFLQLYTPKEADIIAIEPMTGICDSFNNKIGLQILKPKKKYTIDWRLTVSTGD
ncbi:aldose 1-epimerase [Olleya sp. R77988]|uniref:aldose 1-epimerase n=1 Tax=Olleya sp. R77988 TaxID=3093875 RepID=UPI0037C94C82